MTITYSLEVSKARLGGFAKLLVRWRGSIYRLMYREMLIFTLLFYFVAVIYRYVLNEYSQRNFEVVSRYCREFLNVIPITFVMGFYVAMVVGRWWQMYLCIPWPDKTVLQIAAYVQGMDDRGRMIRRALARYLNIMMTLTFQATSTVIKKRFPTESHIVDAGIMTVEESLALEHTVAPNGNWWVPGAWFCQLAMVARKEGRIHDDLHLKSIIDGMLEFRGNCGNMWSYDWISIPLVYTQVVTLAVYSFFIACLIGRQSLLVRDADDSPSNEVDYYFPIFTLFQFFFYMGWLKVGEEMICPYGEDDDDFELNWILDRNVQVSYLAVDNLYKKHPKLTKDVFWDELHPEIPYTNASAEYKKSPWLGSTLEMDIPETETEWNMTTIPEERSSPHPHANDPVHKDDDIESRLSESEQPKMLHQLLAGDSRLSLASRFGSKQSVTSGMATPTTTTTTHSPNLMRRFSFSRHKGHVPKLTHFGSKASLVKRVTQKKHRPSYDSATGDNLFYTSTVDADEFRYPTPLVNHQMFQSKMNSLLSLDNGPRLLTQMSQPVNCTGIDILNELVSPSSPALESKSPRNSTQPTNENNDANEECTAPLESEYLEPVVDDYDYKCPSPTATMPNSGVVGGPSPSVSVPPVVSSHYTLPSHLHEVVEEGSEFGSMASVSKLPSTESLELHKTSRQNSNTVLGNVKNMPVVPETNAEMGEGVEGSDDTTMHTYDDYLDASDDSNKPLLDNIILVNEFNG